MAFAVAVAHQSEGEHFWDWAPERNITTGAIRLTDYNFKTPDAAMQAEWLGDAAHAQGQIESFGYPGDYPAQDVGEIVAGLRTSQERGADRRNRAVEDCASLRAVRRVTLSGDPVPGMGESYLCLSASRHFVSEAYGSGSQGSDGYIRKIVGWRVSSTAHAGFVLDALEQAVHNWRPAKDMGLVHHSNRGSQYLSIRYSERLA